MTATRAAKAASTGAKLSSQEQLVVKALQKGPASRKELARLTKISEARISSLVPRLKQKGIKVVQEPNPDNGRETIFSIGAKGSRRAKTTAAKRAASVRKPRTAKRRQSRKPASLPSLGSQAIIVEDIIDLRGSSPKVIAKMTVGDQQIETVWDLDDYPQELLNRPLSVVGRKPNGGSSVVSLSDGRQEYEITV